MKYPIMFLLFFTACNKNKTASTEITSQIIAPKSDSEKPTIKPEKDPLQETIQDDQILITMDASALPIAFQEEFTKDGERFILTIKNFAQNKIVAEILPENQEMNIRFNQIKFPDGSLDGPFSREISQQVNAKGDLQLIIGRSNMASAQSKGKFTVKIE